MTYCLFVQIPVKSKLLPIRIPVYFLELSEYLSDKDITEMAVGPKIADLMSFLYSRERKIRRRVR